MSEPAREITPVDIVEMDRLRAERDRFREHSMILNRVAWSLHQALGVIPEGATSHWGDILDELPRICELIRSVRQTEQPSTTYHSIDVAGWCVVHQGIHDEGEPCCNEADDHCSTECQTVPLLIKEVG